jgi:hypothetical protein
VTTGSQKFLVPVELIVEADSENEALAKVLELLQGAQIVSGPYEPHPTMSLSKVGPAR